MVNDLDLVAVRIAKVAGPGAVAMRPRPRVERDAAAFEKCRPPVDLVGRSHDHAEMIERRRARRVATLAACRESSPTMQRQVVVSRRQVHVVGIGLPFDLKPEQIDVEALHGIQLAGVERQMAKSGVGGTIWWMIHQLTSYTLQ